MSINYSQPPVRRGDKNLRSNSIPTMARPPKSQVSKLQEEDKRVISSMEQSWLTPNANIGKRMVRNNQTVVTLSPRDLVFEDPDGDLFMTVAQNAYKEHLDNLVACGKCGRKFFPDRIQRHEETCAADPVSVGKGNSKAKASGVQKSQNKRSQNAQ